MAGAPPRLPGVNVGLVSDTHLPRFGRQLPAELRRGLVAARVGLVLHTGDFTAPEVTDLFEEIAPFDDVAGNNDGEEIQARYGRRKVLGVEGVALGMVHGDGARGTTLQRALAAFEGENLDAVLFGHSHIPYCARHGRTWVVNPGSPTDKRRNPLYSYAILEIADGRLVPRLMYYGDRSV